MIASSRRRTLALACALTLTSTGCSAMRENPTACKVASGLAGAAAGAVAGGVGTSEIDSTSGNLEIASGAAIGWVVGGAVGLGIGYFACRAEEPPPPPPPPPPAPAEAVAPAPKRKIVLRGVNFDFDSATLRAEAKAILDEAARLLRDDTSLRVAVDGHTDAIGSDDYNQRLSEKRARSVADALVAREIGAPRLTATGYGESKPAASNDTEEGRAQNRRVELRPLD